MSAIKSEAPTGAGRELQRRYTAADLRVFTSEEASPFVPHGDGDPQTDIGLAWELLYRLEPQLYDRLADAERLHPGVLGWLPRGVDRIAEVGAGSGRLTLELIGRGREAVAVEPARPLRQILHPRAVSADDSWLAQYLRARVTIGSTGLDRQINATPGEPRDRGSTERQ